MKKLNCFFRLFLLIGIILNGYAQKNDIPNRKHNPLGKKDWYLALDAGIGWLDFYPSSIKGNGQTTFVLGFSGGYIPLNWLQVGISLNGNLIEGSGGYNTDLSKGAAISNIFVQTVIYPFDSANFFFKIEGGLTDYWSYQMDGYNSWGVGFTLGLGYEFKIPHNNGISISMVYGSGRFNKKIYDPLNDIYIKNPKYRAFNLPVGLILRTNL